MQTVSFLLCLPKHHIWSCKSQKTCWNSCLAKVLKVTRYILPDGDQLTTQHLASLEHPAHQKTMEDFWSILNRYHVACERVKRYSWCGIRCYNRAAIDTFRSHSVQWLPVFWSHPSTYCTSICVYSNKCVKIPCKDCRFSRLYLEKSIIYFIQKSLMFTRSIGSIYLQGNLIWHTIWQPAVYKNPHTRLSGHTRISTGIEELISAIQMYSSRATSLGWRNSNNIKMIPLWFIN